MIIDFKYKGKINTIGNKAKFLMEMKNCKIIFLNM